MQWKSGLVALLLLVGLIAWVASGHLQRDPALAAVTGESGADSTGTEPRMTVQIQQMDATPITRTLRNQAQTEANRIVVVRAETMGTVEEVLIPRGQRVQAGDALVRLRMDDRDVKLAEARAAIAEAEAAYRAARDLAADGYQSANAVRQAAAALEKARAELKAIELDRERTVIRAPFDGILNDRMVEVGDYLTPGNPVAQVVDNNPLVVAANVAQQDVSSIGMGQQARVRLMNGEEHDGRVRYVASTSDSGTRTFLVEIEIPNDSHAVLAGLSAEVIIPLGEVRAHRVSPALLSLDEENRLVVKTVSESGLVELNPVEIIRNEPTGVWVSGLPDTARVITAGHGFVTRGQSVDVQAASSQPSQIDVAVEG